MPKREKVIVKLNTENAIWYAKRRGVPEKVYEGTTDPVAIYLLIFEWLNAQKKKTKEK